MMLILTVLLFALVLSYSAALLVLRAGLQNLARPTNHWQPTVSVVVAARNEADHIAACLHHLRRQDYPGHLLEIIVVDDRSEDRTAEIVRNLALANPAIHLVQIHDLSPALAPKKRAIDAGIRRATGEIILSTDADCRPGPRWMSHMVQYFEPKVGMVAGYNPYQTGPGASTFQKMLMLDYFSMACVAAASAGLGFPISCTGGNLAYRRALYLQTGGFTRFGSWISGDDDLFLEHIRETTPWKIRYAATPETFVPTAPPASVREFVHQRIRYASKGRRYAWRVVAGLLVVYVMNFLIATGMVFSCFAPQTWGVFLLALVAKSVSECALLLRGKNILHTKFSAATFVLTALSHPFYIALAGLAGQVMTFRWKGQTCGGKGIIDQV
ncbi:MAG: glycosyltransferase [bacterium]